MPTSGCDPVLDETFDFFKFSYLTQQDTFKGTVKFCLTYPDGSTDERSVRVLDENITFPAQAVATEDVVVSMDRDVFVRVYLNELKPRSAILYGQLHVQNFAYGRLKSFCECFDSSTANWDRYYDFQKQQENNSPTSSLLDQHLDRFIDNLSDPNLLCLKSSELGKLDKHVNNVSYGAIKYRMNNPFTSFADSPDYDRLWSPLSRLANNHITTPPQWADQPFAEFESEAFRNIITQQFSKKSQKWRENLKIKQKQWQQTEGWLAGIIRADPFLS